MPEFTEILYVMVVHSKRFLAVVLILFESREPSEVRLHVIGPLLNYLRSLVYNGSSCFLQMDIREVSQNNC